MEAVLLDVPVARRPWAWNAARVLLALFFLAALAYKLVHPAEYWVAAHKLWPLTILPDELRNPATGSVLGLEALAALALLRRSWARSGAVLTAGLLVAFTAIVAPQYNGCACTWQIAWLVPDSMPGFVLRNALLLALALFVAARAR